MSYDLNTPQYITLHKEFCNHLRILGYSPSTVCHLPAYAKEFLYRQELKNRNLTSITPVDIQEHYEYLQTRPNKVRPGGLSSSMIATHLLALRIFFRWLEETDMLKVNPISGLDFPSPEYNRRTALTQQEITQLYEATETLRDKAMLGLFYGCGLRRNEGERINTEDINQKEKILIVREGKGSKRRVVPIAEQVKEDFENYYYNERQLYILKEDNAFMINNKGRRMARDSYRHRLNYLVKKAGIEKNVCLHQLRHSIATHLMEQGMSIEKVRDFLGHKQIDTTQKYTHLNESKLF